MASIDRTNYNLLVDDSGFNLDGTKWTKNQVKTVLLDPIDDLFELEITPAQITANQNDYYPAGTSRCSVMVLTSDAARDVTGIGFVAGDVARKLFINDGGFTITLKHDVTSSAGNRFRGPNNADVAVRPRGSVVIHHRSTYWYIVGA